MGSIALSDQTVPCRIIAPLIQDNVVCPYRGIIGFGDGNLSWPRTKIAPELVAFVSLQAIAAYAKSLDVPFFADTYGLKTHLYKMMQSLAHSCPLSSEQEMMGVIRRSTYLADSFKIETTIPRNSHMASKAGRAHPVCGRIEVVVSSVGSTLF